ncbi:putative F-box/LRR-repeat/kelch-repeat protein At1g11620 [Triticum aestivum]|uniref:putative F-box/LRR-repeat/kelch-repeat protein At1g11620 n=1 Tax=Triticum aestivum TaxID=4565 RepID=UPI001D01BC2F|nr:putative F-box/LRR-repeat/kelch-repeat protein At1g11620 [Triticum aestivum]
MENDDLLVEILVRIPPRPSSLPRVSSVCKRWRRIVADPQFFRRFCAHHREAPIVGVFFRSNFIEPSFRSTLDPPDLIPPELFSPRLDDIDGGGGNLSFRGCCHGRVLFTGTDGGSSSCRQVLVWDPVTGERRCTGSPPQLNGHHWIVNDMQADALCVAGDKGHLHGACHSSPFNVVLACVSAGVARACVYSSEMGAWADPISTLVPFGMSPSLGSQSMLLGSSLYWFMFGPEVGILELNFDRQSLAVIEVPPHAYANHQGLCLSTMGGTLGFIVMSDFHRAQLWERITDFDGIAGWMPGRTIELRKLLPLKSGEWVKRVRIIAGDDNLVLMSTSRGIFMVHLESLQFEEIFKSNPLHRLSEKVICLPGSLLSAIGHHYLCPVEINALYSSPY